MKQVDQSTDTETDQKQTEKKSSILLKAIIRHKKTCNVCNFFKKLKF